MESSHRLPWVVSLLVGVGAFGPALQADDTIDPLGDVPTIYRQELGQQQQQPQQRPQRDGFGSFRRNAPYRPFRGIGPSEFQTDSQPPLKAPGDELPQKTERAPDLREAESGQMVVPTPPAQSTLPTQPLLPAQPELPAQVTPPFEPPFPPAATLPVVSPPPAVPEDVVQLAATIQGELREIGVWLERWKVAPLTAELGLVARESEKLATMAAQRAERSALRVQLDLYKLTWHRFATRLRAAPLADPGLIGHVDAIDRANDLMQELLLVGPGCVYDRVKVAPLTGQLAEVTGLLLRTVKVRALTVPEGAEAIRAAQAVKGHAETMARAVDENLAFTLLLEHYRQFSSAWRELAAQLRAPSPFAPQVRAMMEQIARIDAALHRELIVAPPLASMHARRVKLASSVATLADALTAALCEQLLGSAGPVQAAEEFALKADSLCLWLKDHPMSEVPIIRPEVVAVRSAWRRLENQLNRLERAIFPEAFRIAEQIKGELELLNQAFQP
jgi:hypothetical protein